MTKRVLFGVRRVAGLAIACLLGNAHAAEVRHLSLEEAVQLAIKQNRSLKIARLKVEENEQKKAQDHSAYFPALTNQSNALHITELQNHSGRRNRCDRGKYGLDGSPDLWSGDLAPMG
jgi:outer membrane protein TolC